MQALTPTQTAENNQRPLESLRRAQTLIAIDPGDEVSAWLIYDWADGRPLDWADEEPNASLLNILGHWSATRCVIEGMQSFGMPVGQDVLDTCVWIGRFIEAWYRKTHTEPVIVYRKEVKHHLCNQIVAKDAHVRQALLDRFGPGKPRAVGTIKNKGPLYGISGHVWQALAVAVTAVETGRVPGKSEHHSV